MWRKQEDYVASVVTWLSKSHRTFQTGRLGRKIKTKQQKIGRLRTEHEKALQEWLTYENHHAEKE